MSWDFKFGIEEEYFVNDAPRRDIAKGKIKEFFAACRDKVSGDIHPEMLEPQIEIATKPVLEFSEARTQLAGLRSSVGAVAREFDLSIMASGTHPLAVWTRIRPTAQPRYGKVMHDLQMLGSRNVLCGMHVHVEVPDLGMRVDIMNRIQPYLPLLLALSTSSPFWQAQRTGLLGYRLAAYRELPRTGLPDLFENEQDYQRYIDTLVTARAIENSTYVWWVIRPSLKHPTLELRVADSCTRLDDTIAIAALYRCLVRHLSLDTTLNAGQTGASRAINDENGWRAQRYGIHGSFVDEKTRTAKPVRELLEETLDLVADDAKALGCQRELDLARWIVARGTSADQQLTLYTEAVGRGLSNRDALAGVVDWLSAETMGETAIRH
ncbi:carboxylate-amine ligase [Microvirga lotononidis]|uniref:Putative glutamate--cysteine ligase 2 n=1 Tax=Microvirga lotononidis TaxID=864069 RepID=I4YV31_9HYPH|nr:carboxylate-amine ligase [Microvirga lotononidis]EIM27823.1 carboxylate-amine ligase, YbdK family [Microvirga lotononidis]WQO28047.1 carboxylate-amine ligase [Microvirga lotononidis]